MTMSYLNYPTSIPAQTFTYCSDGSFRDLHRVVLHLLCERAQRPDLSVPAGRLPLPGLGRCPSPTTPP
ncbi:MAG: hypothetical protein ACLTYN_08485 [Dysosmobacter welbionis]